MSLFDGRSKQQRIEDAKKLLLDNGYLVREPLLEITDVKDPSQLVRFFYDRMLFYNPKRRMSAVADPRDKRVAQKFIESRIDTGISKERALIECCILIDILFKYEDDLGISYHITNMGLLGNDKMSWVVERLWRIYESLDAEINNSKEQNWWETFYKKQEETISEERLLAARQRMDRILSDYAKDKED